MKPVKLINLLLSLCNHGDDAHQHRPGRTQGVGPNEPVTTLPTYYLDTKTWH